MSDASGVSTVNRAALTLAASVTLMLASAAPESAFPEELIRRGNDAYLRGDLAAADHLYAAAGERTADPGLVAFNEAAVLVQQGEFRGAEVRYLRALDDGAAPPDRRAKALYNRGVCLLHRGGDAAVYRTAVACFEQCLDLPADGPLTADARHNLELAKQLWNKARLKEKTPPKADDPPREGESDPPSRGGSNRDPAESGGDPPGPEGGPAQNPQAVAGPAPDGAKPRPTPQKAPGAGSLPVLLDADAPQRVSPDDARAYLRRAAGRLEKDRRDNARLLGGSERPNVRDW